MGSIGRLVLGTSSLFMLFMAILINSPDLFYMCTALLVTLGAARLQAYLSVRGLRIERVAPPSAHVGEYLSVSLTVWSDRRIKRPLITLVDGLPKKFLVEDRTPSLPIAPAFDQPIFSRYSFRPLKRGRYRWNTCVVEGTDALGLVTMSKTYITEPAEVTIYPAPIAVPIFLDPAPGWGSDESESSRFRGEGIEPRGVREYATGDALRHVHWPSSARTGRLMVKEFDSGSELAAYFFIQQSAGSEFGSGAETTLEAMCGHAAYLAENFLRQGARVVFPSNENAKSKASSEHERLQQIYEILASVEASQKKSISSEIASAMENHRSGTLYFFITQQDPSLPQVLSRLSNFEVFALIYDPKEYTSARIQGDAAADTYLAQLHASGAKIVMMPRPIQ